MIEVGDKVIYSINGIGQVGVVLRTETKTISGKATDFFVVKLNNSLIVYLPRQFNDIKIRSLSNNINMEAAISILKDDSNAEHTIHPRWDRCVAEAKAMLGYSAPLFGQAECISYLRKIKSKRKLSLQETNLLQEVRDSFLSEVSEIVGKSKSAIETELKQYLN
jgi:RNA polymerase-interacting CarD/CdnL/TRCF family regulator